MTQQHRDTIWNGLISSGECFLLSPNEIDHVLSGRVLLADIPTRDPDAVSTFAKHVAYTLRGRLQFPISQDLFDELFSLIRLRILESIPKYRPGRASDAGYISWGFKAYLYNFAI